MSIEKGKGQKDRYALLPPIMLERLRTWWRYARAEGKVLPGGYLFPGLALVPRLEVADVFRAHGPAWQDAERGHFSLGQWKVMSAIEKCRSAALGGHALRARSRIGVAYTKSGNVGVGPP